MPFIDPERRFEGGAALDEYEDDLKYLVSNKIKSVVCLLNIPSDKAIYEKVGISFLCVPVKDYMPPTKEQMIEIIHYIESTEKPVAVHCEGGIGRTGTVIAGYLIHKGMSFEEAVKKVRSIEPAAIESPEQMKFLQQLSG